MKKKALILVYLVLTGLASTCLAPPPRGGRGGFRGGPGFRPGGRGAFRGGPGFRPGGRGAFRGGPGFRPGGRGAFRGGPGFRPGGRGAFRGRPGFRPGRPGFRPGWGRPGWRWRRGWRGRPYGRYRWCYPYCDYYPYGYGWWPGVGVGLAIGAAYDRPYYQAFLDNAGERYWEITNNTPYPIELRNLGGPRTEIESGNTERLGHPGSFRFTVTSPADKQTFETSDHYISVEIDEVNNLIVNSWT